MLRLSARPSMSALHLSCKHSLASTPRSIDRVLSDLNTLENCSVHRAGSLRHNHCRFLAYKRCFIVATIITTRQSEHALERSRLIDDPLDAPLRVFTHAPSDDDDDSDDKGTATARAGGPCSASLSLSRDLSHSHSRARLTLGGHSSRSLASSTRIAFA